MEYEFALAVGKVGVHLLACHLIVVDRVETLHRESLPQHLDRVQRAVVEEGLDLLPGGYVCARLRRGVLFGHTHILLLMLFIMLFFFLFFMVILFV